MSVMQEISKSSDQFIQHILLENYRSEMSLLLTNEVSHKPDKRSTQPRSQVLSPARLPLRWNG